MYMSPSLCQAVDGHAVGLPLGPLAADEDADEVLLPVLGGGVGPRLPLNLFVYFC